MTTQTQELIKEWNGTIGNMLTEYVLKNCAVQVAEKFDGKTYSRIHRRGKMLIVEEREKGSMYPRLWEMTQDFSDLEIEFQNRISSFNG